MRFKLLLRGLKIKVCDYAAAANGLTFLGDQAIVKPEGSESSGEGVMALRPIRGGARRTIPEYFIGLGLARGDGSISMFV